PIDIAEVMEKFGVPPEKVVDVQSLAGDSTDNVPGVPGIGVKTAAQLIAEYGDLDTLLARADEIKQPKRRQNLIDFADQARVSRQLVRLADDVPLDQALDALQANPDPKVLIGFLEEMEFPSLVNRAQAKLAADAATASAAEPDTAAPPAELAYELVTDAAALKGWVARATEAGIVAVDTETTSLNASIAELVGVSLATAPGLACYIPLGHKTGGQLDLAGDGPAPQQIPKPEALAILKPLLEDPSVLKVGQNLKYDHQILARQDPSIRVAPWDDTMLMSYTLDGGSHGHGMDELAELHLGHTTISFDSVTGTGKARITFDQVPLDKARDYAAEDADITLRLHRTLKPRLVGERMATVYETIERPLVGVIADMERTGIKVDRGVLEGLSRDFAGRLEELEAEIHTLAGHAFNVGSPKQLGTVLFDEMGLPGGKKTKAGAYPTHSDVLEPLAAQGHDIAAKVLDWRQIAKLKGTYTDALVEQINPETGRVHTSFSLAATNTGRLSSNEPNLQNIPIRTEEGRKIRTAFVAEPGCVLLSVDYSQIELRLVAHIAGVEGLKAAF
ncbi:MAG: DNA polymerase I, partial [Rhodospirillaceae bacterium]|nr:DNA polymerase I [Rhodospirillaceae bacterium]